VAVADGRGGEKRIAVTRTGYTAKPGQAAPPAPQPKKPAPAASQSNKQPAGGRP
jgi:hypothetical protein